MVSELVFEQIEVHPLESFAEDNVCGTPCIYENLVNFEIADHELDHEWIAMRFVNSNGFIFLECDHIVWEVERWRPVWAFISLTQISFYR